MTSLSVNHPANVRATAVSRDKTRGFTFVRVVLGLLLLAAAGLKAHALWTDPYPPISIFSSPRWQASFIELETVLGLWLLRGSEKTSWHAS